MPRGGRRPGAGAKPGNLNALRHGRRSGHVQRLLALLSAIPEVREALIGLARRQRAQRRQAERTAAHILYTLLNQALIGLTNHHTDSPPSDSDPLLNALLPRAPSNTEPTPPDPSNNPPSPTDDPP